MLTTDREGVEKYQYKPTLNDGIIREYRDAVKFSNGVIYQGEWNIANNTKDGRGIQIWPDYSKYEGCWRNNSANGNGRLIHR